MDRRCGHREGDQHSCGQVDQIEKLIPAAVASADKLLDKELDSEQSNNGTFPAVDDVAYRWSQLFHAEMDRLTEDAGIRKIVRLH